MTRYLALTAFTLCLLFSSCATLSETGTTGSSETSQSETVEKFQKKHVPIKEIRRQNGLIMSYSVFKYGNDRYTPAEINIYDRHSILTEKILTEKLGIRTEKKSFMDADNNIHRYYVITRDEKGNIVEQILFGGSNRLIAVEEFVYDDLGNKTEWRAYNSSEVLLTFNRYQYENGLNTRTDSYHADGTPAEYFINRYDRAGNLTVTEHYDSSGRLQGIHRTTYKNGLIFREESLGKDKETEWYITYIYSDQYRKVTKTTWSASGEELEQVEQTCILLDR